MSQNPNLEQALKYYFGYDNFRLGQRQIIEQALQNRDLMIVMPTGGGKSLCFQLPALLKKGLTVVVSPLIALMQDQVESLRDNGIAATFLNSSLNAYKVRSRLGAPKAFSRYCTQTGTLVLPNMDDRRTFCRPWHGLLSKTVAQHTFV